MSSSSPRAQLKILKIRIQGTQNGYQNDPADCRNPMQDK